RAAASTTNVRVNLVMRPSMACRRARTVHPPLSRGGRRIEDTGSAGDALAGQPSVWPTTRVPQAGRGRGRLDLRGACIYTYRLPRGEKEDNVSETQVRSRPLPVVASPEEWRAARAALLAEEKAHMRAGDALAAKRRRLPMAPVEKRYVLHGPDGEATLLDLFLGKSQLIVYHFMFHPDWDAGCDGCSWFVDGVADVRHLAARDVAFALVSRAPLPKLE